MKDNRQQIELAKRRAWAAMHFGDRNLTDEEVITAPYAPSDNFSGGWDKGAEHALSHQWISVDERLPEDSTLVFVWGYGEKYPSTNFRLDGKWFHSPCYVRFWMSIPALPLLNPEYEN